MGLKFIPFPSHPSLSQSLLQLPPVEQGGVEQRSSLPQHVCPGDRFSLFKEWATESIFSKCELPHCLQVKPSPFEPIPIKNSEIAPHWLQRYS